MPDMEIDGGWSESAEAWIALAPEHATRKLLLDPILLAEAGDVSDARVLDLGCGEGRFSRLLAERGALTVGIDPIRRLIEAARGQSAAAERYAMASAEALPFADQCFDVVVAYLSLIDIPDFRAAISESARVLKPDGAFLAANVSNLASSTGEPVYDAEGRFAYYAVENYLEERPLTLEWAGLRVRNWHRPLSDYMDAYLGAGLALRRYIEPRPDESLRGEPRFESWFRVPSFDVMVWRKPR
ncbi:MAG TPA: class I SAM-dependent methyltransferase [Dehalococcoidia bacterium]|nr:class I SAM-dependent methyltransferase [Dehalococcoidia bacterium]